MLLFISYFLHCEIKTGDTFLVIGNDKHAIHDGFWGRKASLLFELPVKSIATRRLNDKQFGGQCSYLRPILIFKKQVFIELCLFCKKKRFFLNEGVNKRFTSLGIVHRRQPLQSSSLWKLQVVTLPQ